VTTANWKRWLRPRPLIAQLEIRDLAARALELEDRLKAVKQEAPPPEPGWYPWDSFGNLSIFERLLHGRKRYLEALAGELPMLDLGCGDGELSFLFESIGCRVFAIDHPQTNYNRMGGVAALKAALGSSVRIAAADLDRAFRVPADECGLALCLGLLYHLKNPYSVLEGLAERAHYCLLSTAVTRFSPEGADVNAMAVAFLAGRDGLRGDETNYWIFSETGLRTLVERAGWEVEEWLLTGTEDSLLWNGQADERVFCLLRSRNFEASPVTQLAEGWHTLEAGAWRWTERRFSFTVAGGGRKTALAVTVPDSVELPLTLTVRAAGEVLAVHRLEARGDAVCEQRVPEGREVVVECELDRCLKPDERDNRERGIVVRGIEIGRA
jgi:tRNA (mo5U34)-methyltransferase